MDMETSAEPMDPLTPSVAALAVQPEGGCSVPGAGLQAVALWSFELQLAQFSRSEKLCRCA